MEIMTRELFETGTLFQTKHDRKHTHRYFSTGRIERYFLGMQDDKWTSVHGMVDNITDEGFTVWVELFDEYFEKVITFDDLIIVDEPKKMD